MIKHVTAIFIIEDGIKHFEKNVSNGYSKEYLYGRLGGLLHAFYLSEVITKEEYIRLDTSLDEIFAGVHHA